MALVNTKKSALFLKSGSSLPVPPANFLEVGDEIVIAPAVPVEEFKRISGKLGSNASYADKGHATVSFSVTHKMRMTNSAQDNLATPPEYGELLKIGGFDEAIDTTTTGQETVTYTNTQSPVKGSFVVYIDGYKYEATNAAVADISFNFPIGKAAEIEANISAFLDNGGVPASATNPTVTLTSEPCVLVSDADIFTAGGTSLKPDNVKIETGADIQEFYGMGLKEFSLRDYVIKVTADFYPENADYDSAITKLRNGTTEQIVLKLGTDGTGNLINGKSVLITCDTAQANSFSDSADKSALKRSFTWLLTGNNQISVKHGYFG